MPHLQFEFNRQLTDTDKIAFAEEVRQLFAEVMDTGTDHISLSLREYGTHNLSLGRARQPELGVALVNADIRAGRNMNQRRTLCLGFIELIAKRWQFPKQQIYVTLTEHKGEDFHLQERYLASWQEGEDPLAD